MQLLSFNLVGWSEGPPARCERSGSEASPAHQPNCCMRKVELPESGFDSAGRKGGLARASKLDPETRKDLAKRAAHKRWNGRKLTPPTPAEINLSGCKPKLTRQEKASVVRKNAEELMMVLCGKV